jgi:hypothetical protein
MIKGGMTLVARGYILVRERKREREKNFEGMFSESSDPTDVRKEKNKKRG